MWTRASNKRCYSTKFFPKKLILRLFSCMNSCSIAMRSTWSINCLWTCKNILWFKCFWLSLFVKYFFSRRRHENDRSAVALTFVLSSQARRQDFAAGVATAPCWRRLCVKYSGKSRTVLQIALKAWALKAGAGGPCPLNFEFWHFSIAFLAKMVVF